MEYTYVFTDEQGEQTIIASGEFVDGARPPEEGDSVDVEGRDGVTRPWKVIGMEDVPYAALAIHVEPLDAG